MTQQDVRALLKNAERRLSDKGVDTARLDAELLLAFVLGVERMQLFTHNGLISAESSHSFEGLIKRREAFEPVAYIIGEQDFWSLTFKVTPSVLIPRPDTETLVEIVLKRRPAVANPTILDLGTGSGCILLSLLTEIPAARGMGIDVSVAALEVARENAHRNHLSDRACFEKSNWFEDVSRPEIGYDIIVSNPPYIRSDEMPGLMPDVRDYEPRGALEGGADGLGPYRTLADSAGDFLVPGGLIAVETGLGQTESVANLFAASGFQAIEKHKDLTGIDRAVSAKKC